MSNATPQQPTPGRDTNERGIYFLANDVTFDHSIALVNSLRAYDAETPIALIPYDERHERVSATMADHYGIETFGPPDVLEWIDGALLAPFGGGQFFANPRNFRKHACWFGPFDEFLYLDADIVVFSRIAELIDRLRDDDFVCCDGQHCGGLAHVFGEEIRNARVFSDATLHDIFNAGLWATRRCALKPADLLESFVEAARHPEWFDFSRGGSDQPLMNYLVLKHIARRHNLFTAENDEPGNWAGLDDLTPSAPGHLVDRKGRPLRFLHWAGFAMGPGMPYWETWRHYRELDATLPPCTLPHVEGGPLRRAIGRIARALGR